MPGPIRLDGPRTGPASEGAGATRYVYPHESVPPPGIDAGDATGPARDGDRFGTGAIGLLVHGLKPAVPSPSEG